MPELRIVDEGLWQRVRARRQRSAILGQAVRAGIARGRNVSHSAPRYAFSGLLRCQVCGSTFVIAGGSGKYRAYGCSGYKFGGRAVCTNSLTVRQTIVEGRLLAPIKRDLSAPELLEELQRRVLQRHGQRPAARDSSARIAQLREQIDNLTEAVASGALRGSAALRAKLAQAEAELERLLAEATRPNARVIGLPGRLAELVRKLVATVEQHINRDPHRARAALRQICGEIPVKPHESGAFLIARLGLSEQLLMAAAGTECPS